MQWFPEIRVRGVLVMSTELDPSLVDRLSSRKIPGAFLDIGKAGPGISNIRVNYEKGIHQALEHLFGLGHRQIAVISGSDQFKAAPIPREALLSAMGKNQPSLPTSHVS